jgi:hypothetical protein
VPPSVATSTSHESRTAAPWRAVTIFFTCARARSRRPDPDRGVGWLGGPVDGREQFVPNRIEVDRVSQAQREPSHDRFGVIPGTVEAPTSQMLNPDSERVEQRRSAESRGGYADRRREMKIRPVVR